MQGCHPDISEIILTLITVIFFLAILSSGIKCPDDGGSSVGINQFLNLAAMTMTRSYHAHNILTRTAVPHQNTRYSLQTQLDDDIHDDDDDDDDIHDDVVRCPVGLSCSRQVSEPEAGVIIINLFRT